MVNEVLQYINSGEDDLELGINIVPTSVRAELLWSKATEGLKTIAHALDRGPLQHVETVIMVSWLFSTALGPRIKKLLGKDDIHFEDVEKDNRDAAQIQKLALSFNKKVMHDYLTSGQLPEVKMVKMSKKEFIAKFLQ